MTPKLTCDHCQDVIGVYEPVVAVRDGEERETSLAADPMLSSLDGELFHRACYLERSAINNG